MKTLVKICRPIAVIGASVALVYNIMAHNWIGVSVNVATLVVVL